MLENLIKAIGRMTWEEAFKAKMRYYMLSMMIYIIVSILMIVTGSLLLYSFYNWLLAIEMTVSQASLGTAILSFAAAGLITLFWKAFHHEKHEEEFDRHLLEEVLKAFLHGLQTEEQPTSKASGVVNIHQVKKSGD